MRTFLALAALLLVLPAAAQTVTGNAAYSWKLPTDGCVAGSSPCVSIPLTGANAITSVEAFISTSPIPDSPTGAPTLTLSASATTATYTGPVANGATLYARFRAVNTNGKGLLSAEVTKVIKLDAAPGQITNVTVSFAITAVPATP